MSNQTAADFQDMIDQQDRIFEYLRFLIKRADEVAQVSYSDTPRNGCEGFYVDEIVVSDCNKDTFCFMIHHDDYDCEWKSYWSIDINSLLSDDYLAAALKEQARREEAERIRKSEEKKRRQASVERSERAELERLRAKYGDSSEQADDHRNP